jgi:undecaprenyl diphosphate synthase
MELFCKSVMGECDDLKRQGVRVKVMGERTRFSERVLGMIDHIERFTEGGERLTLVLAFNYSSRREMVLAVQDIAQKVKSGVLDAESIDEGVVANHLMTCGMPDPDMIIRTSGECRLSNFLLWQASYAEFYFPEVMWPDFTEEEFDKAIAVFAQRERRYGLVTEEN